MPIGAFKLPAVEGEYVDGPSHVETDVQLELGRLGEQIVLTQTTTHRAAPDRSIRCELSPEEAARLTRELEAMLDE